MTESPAPKEYLSLSKREVDKRWRPKLMEPIERERCTVIMSDNKRCPNKGLAGLDAEHSVCRRHGGNLPNVQAMATAQLEAARMKLLDSAEDAVDTLIQLQEPGTAEGIRLKAATEVLDRVGIRGGFELAVEQEVKDDPSAVIAARLTELAAAQRRQSAQIARITGGADDSDVVDAEVVDE